MLTRIATLDDAATAGMWILSGTYGTADSNLGTYFSDLIPHNNLPVVSRPLKHLKKISVWSNNAVNKTLIQGYEMEFDDRTFRNPPEIHNGNDIGSLSLALGEYITQIETTFIPNIYMYNSYGLSSVEIKSSTGRLLFMGKSSGEKSTYRAPIGWRIVGFHGMANWSNDHAIPSIGAICAPVL